MQCQTFKVADLFQASSWFPENFRKKKALNLIFTSLYIWRRQWHPTPVLLPGKSHGWRSLVGCSPWGREELDTTELLHFHFSLSCIGEGNGNPLQCSCLENPRDGGAWWAAIYGVTQSRIYIYAHYIYTLYYIYIHAHTQIHTYESFPRSSVSKESVYNAYNAGDLSSIPGSVRSPGEGNGNPLQYSCLENPPGQRSLAVYSPWDCKSCTRLSTIFLSFYTNIYTHICDSYYI